MDSDRNPPSALLKASLMSGGLAVLKLATFFASGSLVVLTSALDSIIDAIVSLMNAQTQKFAKQRPDREHPFGHGGFEVAVSVIQGGIMTGSGLYVGVEAISRLFTPDDALALSGPSLGWSVGVLVFSAAGGILIQKHLGREQAKLHAREERSLALTTDQAHYLGDVWLNLSAAVGVLIVWATGISALDAGFALIGAALLLKAAFPVLKHSFKDIVHREIDPALQQRVADLVMATDPRIKGIHRLRSRELGPTRFVDFHLVLPAEMTLQEAHGLGEKVVANIRRSIPRMDVLIHLDPETEPDDEIWEPSYQAPKGD